MNTYNWNIKLMDTIPSFDGYEDFVTRVYWDYIGVNESGVSSKVEGYSEWNVVNEPNFISYADITLEDVTNWLEEYNDTNNLQSIITKKIEDIINPPIINLPLPWVTTTTTEPPSTTTTTTEEPTTTTTTEPPIEETTTTTTEPPIEETTTEPLIEETTTTTTEQV
jgi:hypothetical protein